tara:strand:+ start:717 stop:923 length:207 start_codon:yes stop_codon:yes gene_type:complete
MVEDQKVLERLQSLGMKLNSRKLKEAIALMPTTIRNLKLIFEGGGCAANENDSSPKLLRLVAALQEIL